MKNILFATAIAAVILMGSSMNSFCGLPAGFIDDDTFRASGIGLPSRGGSAPAEDSACQAALLMAQANLLRQLAESGIREVKGSVIVDSYRVEKVEQAIRTSFAGIIRNVRVVEKTYDAPGRQCHVVIEVSESNLKNKVKTSVARVLK